MAYDAEFGRLFGEFLREHSLNAHSAAVRSHYIAHHRTIRMWADGLRPKDAAKFLALVEAIDPGAVHEWRDRILGPDGSPN